jgi:hypothetical protein
MVLIINGLIMASLYFTNKNGLKLVGILEKPVKKTEVCILLCHGATVDKEEGGIFTTLSKNLSKAGFAVFRFDFMGHGESNGNTLNTTIKSETQDIESALKLLTSKGYRKFGILAASFSGGPASYFVIHHPKKINALIYWNSALEYTNLLKRWLHSENKELLRQKGYIIWHNTKYGKNLIRDMNRLKPRKELYKIKIPVMFIHGNKDLTVPYSQSAKYAKIMNAELKTVRGGTHGLHGNKKHFNQASHAAIAFFLKNLK